MPARKPLLAADAAAFVRGGGAALSPPIACRGPAPADDDGEARVRFTVDLPRSLHKRL